MAAISNIVLADGQTTPANKTFVPFTSQVGSAPAVWYEKTAANPLGYRRITLSVNFKSSGVSKVRLQISDPVLASMGANCCVDTNTPVVSYTDIFDATFSLPSSSTQANRKDILAYAKNMLGTAVMQDAVWDLTPVF